MIQCCLMICTVIESAAGDARRGFKTKHSSQHRTATRLQQTTKLDRDHHLPGSSAGETRILSSVKLAPCNANDACDAGMRFRCRHFPFSTTAMALGEEYLHMAKLCLIVYAKASCRPRPIALDHYPDQFFRSSVVVRQTIFVSYRWCEAFR
jgi:hypothetical protein